MTMSRRAAITAAAALALVASGAAARVSPQKAEKLGKTLTPVGATRAGSKDGRIPPWTGGLSRYPASVKSRLPDIKYKGNLVAFLTRYYNEWGDKALPNPYGNDKVKFTITSKNYRKYADHLPPGLIAMFRHYKDFRMKIYPTRRSAAYPKKVYAATRKNATRATLHGLNGVENAAVGFPFPIPQSAPQVMWNHMLGWHFPNSVIVHEANAIVSQSGSYYLVGNTVRVKFWYDRFGMTPKKLEQHKNMNVYLISQVVSPARLAGNVLLVWEPINLEKQHRSAWIYNPGQ
ncbi:MAG TPA: DUF1329 domain-containing protein, partial [Gammaproteobacteria bacterium]|nr:DUF1329 domain-containing protein [Gammaproteobacteria bacterium]